MPLVTTIYITPTKVTVLCGFPETGDEFEGENSEERPVTEGGVRQSASWRVGKTAPELLG